MADIRSGVLVGERAWDQSGSGDTENFDLPYWQNEVLPDGLTRACSDVSMPGGNGLWTYYLGDWYAYAGTSFSSPLFAGLVAVVNEARADRGLPAAGFLNPILYLEPDVRESFNDVTEGSTPYHAAEVGWDYPTGWGSPNAEQLAEVLP